MYHGAQLRRGGVGSVGVRRGAARSNRNASFARTAIQNFHFVGIDLPRSRFIKIAPYPLVMTFVCLFKCPAALARRAREDPVGRPGGWFPSRDLGKVNKCIGSPAAPR